MKKTTILILVLLLGSVTLASAGDLSAESKTDIRPTTCNGALGFFASLVGASCGPAQESGISSADDQEKKKDVPQGNTLGTQLVRRIGGR